MIKKINKIHYKSFDNYNMSEFEFKRINLIYGLNGMGKSSFKHFLEEQIQNKENDMDNIQYSQENYQVFSYDENYKRNTLYINDDSQQDGFGSFYLGNEIHKVIKIKAAVEQSIQKAQEKQSNQKKRLKEIENRKDVLKQNIAKETRKNLEKIDPKSYKTPQSYTKNKINDDDFGRAKMLNDDELYTLQSYTADKTPNIIELPNFSNTTKLLNGIAIFKNMLQQTPENEAIEKFKQDDELENFAKIALNIRAKNPDEYNEKCPLCEQEITAIKLWDNLEKHFNQEYHKFIERLEKAKEFFAKVSKELMEFTNWLNKNLVNENLLYKREEINIDKLRQDYLHSMKFINDSIKTICHTLDEKIETPNKSGILLDIDEKILNECFAKIISDEIKGIIVSHNIQQSRYADIVKENTKKIQQHFIAKSKEEFFAIQRNIKINQNRIEKYVSYLACCNKKIEELDSKLMELDISFQSLNDDLYKHFRLEEIRFEKISDSHYQTQRKDCKGNWFDCKNGLSEGEKTIIAVIYFVNYCLAFLEQQQNICPIIILDDPITSLDNSKRDLIKNYIIQKIIEKDRGQIFILSHDKNLLSRIYNGLKNFKQQTSIFNIKKQDKLKSNFQILKKLRSEKELREFYNRLKEGVDEGEIQNEDDIRKLLEGLIAIIFDCDDSKFANDYDKLLQHLEIKQRFTSDDIQKLNHNKTSEEYDDAELCDQARFAIEIFDATIAKIIGNKTQK